MLKNDLEWECGSLTPSGVRYSPLTWMPITRQMTISEWLTSESPWIQTTEWTLHSKLTGDSATRGGLLKRREALVTLEIRNSSPQDSTADWLTLSRRSYLDYFASISIQYWIWLVRLIYHNLAYSKQTPPSLVSCALTTESLLRPLYTDWWPINKTVGGSNETLVNWL